MFRKNTYKYRSTKSIKRKAAFHVLKTVQVVVQLRELKPITLRCKLPL